MPSLMELLGFLVSRHPWKAWIVVMLVTAASVWGLLGKRLIEQEASIDEADETVVAHGDARKAFRFLDFSEMVVLESDDFFRPDRIATLRRLVVALEGEYGQNPVFWIETIPIFDGIDKTSLLPPPDASPESYEAARREALAHPLVAGQLLSEDGRTMLLFINVSDLTETIDATIARELAGTGIVGRLTGQGPIQREYGVAFKESHMRIVVLASLLVLVSSLLVFRSLSAMLIATAAPFMALLWTLGLFLLFDVPINGLTEIILPVMILMIAFTDGVHLVYHLRHAKDKGAPPREAAYSAVAHVGGACALTSVTTAIGFASLMLSGAGEVRDFGFACAFGVLIAFWAVVLIIPLLGGSWIGARFSLGHARADVGARTRRFGVLVDFVIRHSRWVVAGSFVAAALLAWKGTALRPDWRLADLAPNNSEAYDALLRCDEAFGGTQYVYVSITWPDDASTLEIWKSLELAESAFEDEPLTSRPLSVRHLLSLIPFGDQPLALSLADRLPPPFGELFWHSRERRALVVARVRDLGITAYDSTFDRIDARLVQFEDSHPGFQLNLTGRSIVGGREMQRLVAELGWSLLLASVVIFAVLSIAFRSLKLGLISAIPNLFPLIATAALRAWWAPSLDIASACAFVICLGIAVDDTIHFLNHYRLRLREGDDAPTAIRETFTAVGGALLTTTVVLIAGFGVVLTSRLPIHQLFAAMAIATILTALLADLILLPALLICFGKNGRHDAR